ncbi:glutamine synthetase [Pseudomonas sp. R4-84]
MPSFSNILPIGLLLLFSVGASAHPPTPANCTRSANLLACVDAQGNAYSVFTAGNTFYLRGFEASGRRYWSQTNSRYGQLTFFTGFASDGEAWVGYSRRVGWTTINRFSSSGGGGGRFVCGRMSGCEQPKR